MPDLPDLGTAAVAARRVRSVIVLGLLTVLLGVAAVLAPVVADDPVLTWPQAGEAPTSTVLPLSPYRPLDLRAEIPCATLAAVDRRGGDEVLRTLPADVDATLGTGLVVAVNGGTVRFSTGPELLAEPLPPGLLTDPLLPEPVSRESQSPELLPAGGCSYVVTAGAGGVAIARDGVVLVERPDLLAPQVAELETGAEGLPQAVGLRVQLHTDARYQSQPSALKVALLVAHALALAALLVLALRTWPGRDPGPLRVRPAFADAAVVAVSAAWVVLGPVNIDDSWYVLMARGAQASGYLGNAIYQFNVTENPFVASQYALQAWGGLVGWSLLWLRMLPLLYGLVTYAVLRLLLVTALGRRIGERPGVVWALVAAHLVWFLGYGITLRPETLIVLGTAVVMLLTESARRRESLGVLVVAAMVAALTLTTSPTGVIAAAPLVPAVPWLGRWVRGAPRAQRWAMAGLAVAVGTVVVPVGFADASLGDVLESVAVHRWYYRQHPWYDEFVHYAHLLEQSDQGSWGKRLPMLLTLAVLATVLVGVGRRAGTGGPTGRLLASSALVTTLGLASMALTPTKWVNHFGAIAAPATVLLTLALVRSPLPRGLGLLARRRGRRATAPTGDSGRSAPHRDPGRPATAVAVALVVAAAAIAFAGPNLWRPFSDWGQPFGNHALVGDPFEISLTTPGTGPFELRNPLLWLAVAGSAWWWSVRRSRLAPERAVLGVAVAGGLGLFLVVFVAAPLSQAPGPSVASINLGTATGQACGLAPHVRVLRPADLTAPVGDAVLTADMTAGRPPGREIVGGLPDTAIWHTDVVGSGTGGLLTGWYPIPPGASTDVLIVPVTGDLRDGQRVALEFGVNLTPAAGATPTGRVELPPAGLQAGWVTQTFPLSDTGAERPQAVRLQVQDRLAGPDTWLAVGAPRLATRAPIDELLAGRPVFADQVSALFWPCVEQVTVRDGIAQAPAVRLRAGDGLEDAIVNNAVFVPNGGALAGIARTAHFMELPSALDPPGGSPMLAWGHVEEIVYDHPVGRYDLTVDRVTRDGWTRLPTLVGEAYTGRTYIG